MSDDYYAVLELTRSATEGDIRKAYRRMALRWHPDKNQDNKEEAHLKFKEISEAYEVLSDPNKRQIYDVYGKAGLETDNGSGGGRSHSRHHAGFHHDFHSFVFRDPQEVFREFFGNRDPFSDFMFIDPFAAFGRQQHYQQQHQQQQQQQVGNLFQSNFIGFPTMQMHDPFFSFGQFGGLGSHAAVGGGGAAQFMSFSSSGLGPSTQFRSSSTSTRVVNGRQIVTKKVVENGVETVTVTENGRVVSKTVNGQAQSIEGPSGANAAASSSSSYGAGHHGYGSRAGGAAPAPRISSAHSLSGGGGRPGSSGSGGGVNKRYSHQPTADQQKRQKRREDRK
ncbi:hypothetical protein BOX15_Mlig032064g2 [Macrostomum lignano]|uniref:J domain-containing protein n=1 Tax=Macrostomum lignano TaxID=282301 RepID=A0A267E2X1_9PLAT|nr:hypothetical protein BOX15_Mlig032064g2 [Macrostomum lignano]